MGALLIIVTGPSATGKTSLAERLSEDLSIPLIAKDTIKEQLFNSLGWSDRAWSRKIGGASYDLGYIIRDPQGVGTGTVYAVAETSLALFDFATNAPRRATQVERDCLRARLGGPAPLRRRR